MARAVAEHHRADEADMVRRHCTASVRDYQAQFGGQAPSRDVDKADVSLGGRKLRTSRTAPYGARSIIVRRRMERLVGSASV